MNSDQLQNIIVAWNKCCESTATKFNATHDDLDEWLAASIECCETVNENADEIIELLTEWAAVYEATYTDFQCGLVDNELTTTTTTLPTTTTTIPVTTTTTTIDPDLIEWEVVFENYLCQQEDDPTVITTTTIPLKSGTIVFEATYNNFLCEKVDNPAITTTTTTISGTTTTTTSVAPDDIAFSATYTEFLCEKVNNPLHTTTTTTTTINEDDILWEIVFENYLCQQEDVVTTTTTTTTLPVTTTTTTTSEMCGIEISGEYAFPETYNINLGPETGTVYLNIDTLDIPDKFIVEWNGSEVINTGYRGDVAFQNELYSALASEGAIPEAIVGDGIGLFSFEKNTADPIAILKVYAPIADSKWTFTLNCPGTITTTTVNPTEVDFDATYTDFLCGKVDNPNITTTTTTVPTTTTTTPPVTTTTTTIGEYEINCGQTASGGEAYPMEVYITDLGAGTGYVSLNYDAGNIPDKFIVEVDGFEVINTGYRGDSDLQPVLDNALTEKGEPLETIQGVGIGSETFFKSSATTIAIVKVFAPIDEADWEFILTCPDGGTTTTTTSTTAVPTTTTTSTALVTTTTTTNALPISQNNTINSGRSIGNCSVSKVLTPSDFPFTDAEGDALGFVKIDSYTLLGSGELKYKNKIVNNGDILRVFGGVSGSFQHTLEYFTGSIVGSYSDYINFSVRTENNLSYSNISILTIDNDVCGITTTTTIPVTTTTTTCTSVIDVANVESVNAPTYLVTPTYDGSGETVHPDIYYTASGWNGYDYWMVMSPFPGGDDDFANPSIIVSNDGDTWIEPPGITNPLAPYPGAGNNNSDPCIFMGLDSKLWVIYRERIGTTINLRAMSSTDGVTWSSPQTILTGNNTLEYISPAVIIDGGEYAMYYTDWSPTAGLLYKKTSADVLTGWGSAIACTNTGLPVGDSLFHLDILKFGTDYHLFATSSESVIGTNTKQYFGTSCDGINFIINSTPVISPSISGWDDDLIYKATAVLNDDGPNYTYDLWYSGRSSLNVWHIGRTTEWLYGAPVSTTTTVLPVSTTTTTIWVDINDVNSTNAATALTIPTYDGSGQAAHPDVYYNAAGWNGYKYWMAMTPAPGGDDDYENPSIIVSNDGDTWIEPPGITNPIYPFPGGAGHNADVDIFIGFDSKMWIVFIEEESNGNVWNTLVMSTSDGINWSAATTIATHPTGANIVSPSIIKVGSEYWMYSVDFSSGTGGQIMERRISSLPDSGWSAPETVTLNDMPVGRYPWHQDVIVYKSEYHMLLTTSSGASANPWNTFAISPDGLIWQVKDTPIVTPSVSGWDNNLVYRGTLVLKNDGSQDYYDTFYSGANDSIEWGIGRTNTYFTIQPTTTTTIPVTTTTTTVLPVSTTTTTIPAMLVDLVSVWEFDETSGTTAVDSHGGYDGAITGGVTLNQAGVTNITPEYQFDGVDGKIITTMPDGGYRNGNAFAFSVWIKPNFSATTGTDQIFSIANGTNSDDNEVTLRQNGTTNELMLFVRSGGANAIITSQALTNGQRYHVVAISTGTQIELYINNAEVANSPVATSGSIVQVTGSKLVFGYATGVASSVYYNGNMDQVANWTRELTSQERADLYDSGDGFAYVNW